MTVLLMKVTGILTFHLCLPTKITGQQSIVSDPYIIVRNILLIHKRCVVILNICMRGEVKSIETYCVNPSKDLIFGVNVITILYMFFCFSFFRHTMHLRLIKPTNPDLAILIHYRD